MTIGGLPLPGCEPPLDPELELEPELEPELALDPPDALEDDDELPQAASTTTAIRTTTAASAGFATDRIRILQQLFGLRLHIGGRVRLHSSGLTLLRLRSAKSTASGLSL
jgi:hypothetical protein